MIRVAIVCKPQKEELTRLLPELIDWLRAHSFEPVLDLESGKYVPGEPAVDRAELPALAPALVIVLGGDGYADSQRQSWISRIPDRSSAGRSVFDAGGLVQ